MGQKFHEKYLVFLIGNEIVASVTEDINRYTFDQNAQQNRY